MGDLSTIIKNGEYYHMEEVIINNLDKNNINGPTLLDQLGAMNYLDAFDDLDLEKQKSILQHDEKIVKRYYQKLNNNISLIATNLSTN